MSLNATPGLSFLPDGTEYEPELICLLVCESQYEFQQAPSKGHQGHPGSIHRHLPIPLPLQSAHIPLEVQYQSQIILALI